MRRILSETVLKIGSKEIPVSNGKINGEELMQALKDAGVECEGDAIEVEIGVPGDAAGPLDMPPGQEVVAPGPEAGPPPMIDVEGGEEDEGEDEEEEEEGEEEEEEEEEEGEGEEEEKEGNPFAESKKNKGLMAMKAKKAKKENKGKKGKKTECEDVSTIANSIEESIIERVY